jgi:hypothetical protein
VYAAPACASWFRYNAIHEHERAFCPDFFNKCSSSKTAEVSATYNSNSINCLTAECSLAG